MWTRLSQLCSLDLGDPISTSRQHELVWWAPRGHPDDFLMAVWLVSGWKDVSLSPCVCLCLHLSSSTSCHLKGALTYRWAQTCCCKRSVSCMESLPCPVLSCSALMMTRGCVRSPAVSLLQSEMRPDTVPTLLPLGVGHAEPRQQEASLVCTQRCCTEILTLLLLYGQSDPQGLRQVILT